MQILVCVKAVPDFDQIMPSGSLVGNGSDPLERVNDESELHMNRFDEPAVEEAVLIKESFSDVSIDIVSMGPDGAQKVIKRAMGMGADNGTHIQSSYKQACDAMQTASAISTIAGQKPYDLILAGVMSEDMMQFQFGPMLAQYLDIPWATAVIRTAIEPEKSRISIDQELEGGAKALIEMDLPALVTIQTGINIPRYPSLSNMLRANQTGIGHLSADALAAGNKKYTICGYAAPDKKRDGRVIEGTPKEKAEKLIRMLQQKSLLT